jgi:hypothetical protein
MLQITDMHDLHQVCHFMTRFPTQANCKHEENWPTLLLHAIIKAKGFSSVGFGEKFGPKKAHCEGEWNHQHDALYKERPKHNLTFQNKI